MRSRKGRPNECLKLGCELRIKMFTRVFAKYNQALIVGGCAMTSFVTMGWMVTDIHQREKSQIKKDYENKLEILTREIEELKANKSDILNLK